MGRSQYSKAGYRAIKRIHRKTAVEKKRVAKAKQAATRTPTEAEF